MTELKRRKILITGGTDGIGLSLAKRLAARHDVVVTGRRPVRPEQLLPSISYILADQSQPLEAAAAIKSGLAQLGWHTLDNAVLNAGIGVVAEGGIDSTDTIRRTLDVNLSASIATAHALYPMLADASGTLTIIGSVAYKGQALFPAYAASKAGLDALSRALASEWRGKVQVQMLHPGPTRTDMHAKANFDPGRMRQFFIAPDAMAAMIEASIAKGQRRKTLSFAARALHAVLPERLI
jgi:NAD(P)-dependent dehydrogenase (short-subunit alcohol dehydrogenase family)